MRVVQQVARKVRNFSENLLRDYRMLLCRHQNVEAWRGKQRLYEVPSLRHVPRSSHHPWVGRHAQKFIQDRPGRYQASARPRQRSNQPRQLA